MENRLDKYISNLLFDYDCVIIPRLGGIVTNYKPAYFHEGMAYPPSKELRFNKNLTKNDGLLSQSIADREKISIHDADAFLHQTVEHYLKSLNGGQRVVLDKVGILYIDSHESLRFTPDPAANYLRQSYGFEVFKLPPKLHEKDKTSNLPNRDEKEPEVIPLKSDSHTKGIYRVAAAALAPFLAMSLYLGLTTDFKSPTEISPAEIFPMKNSVKASYTPRNGLPFSATASSSDRTNFPEGKTFFPFDFTENRVTRGGVMVNLSEGVDEKAGKIIASGTYHIIGGCFGEKLNAERFVSRLQKRGYPAAILDRNKGLYRVRISSFGDYDVALGELNAMREDGTFPGAWLLKKNTD